MPPGPAGTSPTTGIHVCGPSKQLIMVAPPGGDGRQLQLTWPQVLKLVKCERLLKTGWELRIISHFPHKVDCRTM